MINFEYELIMIHIPKTAGTSIEVSITESEPFWWKKFRRLKHKPASLYKNHCIISIFWDKFFKFSITRNPFDQLVSHYFFNEKNKDKTRKDFYNYVMANEMSGISYYIDEDLDYIGKFENLSKSWNDIKRLSKIPKNRKLPDFRYCETVNRIKEYKSYYTPVMVNKLRKEWKNDLDLYNYDY